MICFFCVTVGIYGVESLSMVNQVKSTKNDGPIMECALPWRLLILSFIVKKRSPSVQAGNARIIAVPEKRFAAIHTFFPLLTEHGVRDHPSTKQIGNQFLSLKRYASHMRTIIVSAVLSSPVKNNLK